jgi:hypothetical protein
MSEGSKRNLRERRPPKSLDSDVNIHRIRMKILILMDITVILIQRYSLAYTGSESSFTTTQLRGQTIREIYK